MWLRLTNNLPDSILKSLAQPDPLAARLRSRGFIDQSFDFYNCRKVVFSRHHFSPALS
jgi:hypothetical protein